MMKVTVQTLSQSLRHLFMLRIVSYEFGSRFSTSRRLVYLGSHGDGSYVHSKVLAVEGAAEGTGTGVGRGRTRNAQVPQCPLDIGRRREETT